MVFIELLYPCHLGISQILTPRSLLFILMMTQGGPINFSNFRVTLLHNTEIGERLPFDYFQPIRLYYSR